MSMPAPTPTAEAQVVMCPQQIIAQRVENGVTKYLYYGPVCGIGMMTSRWLDVLLEPNGDNCPAENCRNHIVIGRFYDELDPTERDELVKFVHGRGPAFANPHSQPVIPAHDLRLRGLGDYDTLDAPIDNLSRRPSPFVALPGRQPHRTARAARVVSGRLRLRISGLARVHPAGRATLVGPLSHDASLRQVIRDAAMGTANGRTRRPASDHSHSTTSEWLWFSFEHTDNIGVPAGAPVGVVATYNDSRGPQRITDPMVNRLPAAIPPGAPLPNDLAPVQVVRASPLDGQIESVNRVYQNHALILPTRWHRYQLVVAQWPRQRATGGAYPASAGVPFPDARDSASHRQLRDGGTDELPDRRVLHEMPCGSQALCDRSVVVRRSTRNSARAAGSGFKIAGRIRTT